ncbi:MAG: hypothetical protein KDJ98_18020, partial [Rhodobacteraceae bacterium]|nr:hypothetical protein [Paracoccaceae bacterium]
REREVSRRIQYTRRREVRPETGDEDQAMVLARPFPILIFVAGARNFDMDQISAPARENSRLLSAD